MSVPEPDATRTAMGTAGAEGPGTHLHPGQRFGSRYTIIRALGSGGMGAVYQAWDESLGIPVALKTIRFDPGIHPLDLRELEERFKRELRLARQVTHPNVVRIHDLGELGPIKYLTMAYVQGADLATLLRTHGRFPIDKAIAIARQVAAGLAAAHEAGVVHRDLKPANVLVDAEDRALLTDFGIARAVDAATIHTLPGAVIGTLGYMAPEQARGEPVDERSDIYSFGLILYEMLAGGRPRQSASNALAELVQRVQHGPPPLRDLVPDVPADVERIVTRCLQSDPPQRYQKVADLLADLNRLGPDGRAIATPVVSRRPRWWQVAAAALVAAGLVAGTWWGAGRARQPVVQAPRPPVSVLIADFQNLAGDPVFEGALEQALGIAIEGAPFITSYPRKSAADLASDLRPGHSLDREAAQLVALREGIGIVLAGSIERRGGGYRLAISALRSAPAETVATVEATARDKGGVLEAVAHLAGEVRTALGDTTPSAALQAETYSAGSLEAVHEYSLAQDLTTDSRNEEAIQHYRAAIERDPRFGRAYAGWAASAYDLGRRAEAEELWKKALSLMDRMTEREKYRTLGGYFMNVARNYEKAIENYRELVAQYPADSAGRNNLAIAYFYTHDFARALEEGRRAIEIYPRSLKFQVNFALYAMYAGDFATAVASARQVLDRDPKYDSAYLPLAMAALAEGDPAGARAVYDRARQAGSPGASLAGIGLADVALYEGRLSDAATTLEQAIPLDEREGNTYGAAAKLTALAEALARLNRTPDALRAAERALSLARDEFVAVPAARVFTSARRDDLARKLSDDLTSRGQPLPRAYAHIIAGELERERGRQGAAIAAFAEAIKSADVWLARFHLGVAYVEAGRHAEAIAELGACQKRRGEATAIFLDDLPTYRYIAVLPYWRARAEQGLGMAQAARGSFEQFLRIRTGPEDDALVSDARSRLAALAAAPAE
jgi:tetratricopeptide (TPR) repeat protein